jgi:hypothetical protein
MAREQGLGWLVTMLLLVCGLLLVVPVAAEEKTAAVQPGVESCSELAQLLVRQEEKTSRELKQIKRDLAALSQQFEEPGVREILGGVGYILGIFGVAAYVASRRQSGSKG